MRQRIVFEYFYYKAIRDIDKKEKCFIINMSTLLRRLCQEENNCFTGGKVGRCFVFSLYQFRILSAILIFFSSFFILTLFIKIIYKIIKGLDDTEIEE